MTRREYATIGGERLVVQGGRDLAPLPRRLDVRYELARATGRCSSCEAAAPPESLDPAGRCFKCQP